MASGLVLSGVSKEKENRVIEVLLLSVSPGQMLAGKVLAQGAVGLVQAGVWVGIGALTFWLSGESLDLLSGFSPSPAVIAWSVLFMLLGYALYACLGAGVGCLVPDLKASRGAPVLLYAPAFVGFEINLLTHSSPNGVLSTAASLVPLTSPFVIFRRLLAGGMPLWQTALSALLLVLAIVLVARATAHMFRAQNLLSGQRFSARRYLRALMG